MQVERVAVVGAGTMGRGIAQIAATAGFQVSLQDIEQEQLNEARGIIEDNMGGAVEKEKLTEEELEEALGRVSLSTSLKESVENADIVIEAVLESMDLKVDIFQKLDRLCKTESILATNTSTMSPTELGASTDRADRCVAMHFFNPVHKMKLVEIIRGLDTLDETYETAQRLVVQMGKEAVEVNEFPGFVTSRMNCLIGNEAMNMLMEGVASAEDIDKAIKLGLGHPMGPLELADLVGLDSRLRNTEYLHETLGERFLPSPLLVKYVKAGQLGCKSGKGFYDYDES